MYTMATSMHNPEPTALAKTIRHGYICSGYFDETLVMADIDRQAEYLLPLTPAVYHILLALADDDRHGLGVMQEVERRTDGKVRFGPGTLYGTIKRMLGAELIDEAPRPEPDADDPRRRYYRITKLGRRVATLEAERLSVLLGIARDKNIYRRRSRA